MTPHLILTLLESSTAPVSREDICAHLAQHGVKLHPRDVQDHINALNAELKPSRLIVSIPGKPGYFIPRVTAEDVARLKHASATFRAHEAASGERASEIESLTYRIDAQLKRQSFESNGQGVMFA
jgi:hypothetical protein